MYVLFLHGVPAFINLLHAASITHQLLRYLLRIAVFIIFHLVQPTLFLPGSLIQFCSVTQKHLLKSNKFMNGIHAEKEAFSDKSRTNPGHC